MSEFQEAIERVIAGPERRSRLITPHEKMVVAYHEAGHAIAMHFLPEHDPVHKVTIVPRGMAGGYTLSLPDEETHLITEKKFKEQLVALLGGRVAEEIRFGDITTGASNDLERVTKMTRAMVTQWGMSEKLGPIRYGESDELVFLGREISERRNYSDRIAQQIDEEVRELVDEAHRRCHQLLNDYWDKLELVTHYLLEVKRSTRAIRGHHPRRESVPGRRADAGRRNAREREQQCRERQYRWTQGQRYGHRRHPSCTSIIHFCN